MADETPDEPFIFDPTDPECFSKMREHITKIHDKDQRERMRHEAVGFIVDSWVEELNLPDTCILYYLLLRFNPSAGAPACSDGGVSSHMLDLQHTWSMVMGSLNHKLKTLGINAEHGPEQILEVILREG
ncbi:hypothetical protein SEA_JUMBO_58 [Gordonia phage Jumbo]|uniref:Uncharacterized protein n=1 Tax=Gordonia phage Jumbo TaxID=1887650 RepID=A0A1B3B0R8_9CAUD|nr:hypothetical protein BIZ69_gp058 [Gordonia phage Jumbo]AOE44566.1 hypothetical protein SEA_JUMBO_58 [Gordonia phage Jumbo]